MRFGGIKFVRRIRKPWEGKRPAGGREGGIWSRENLNEKKPGKGREVSVGLVRRRIERYCNKEERRIEMKQEENK
ncbi:hypothetical protein BY996DRAFT_8396268 [Phakopsora pachyrhizi]|nr:hypothetical protein BY996DRAFT_8396268 [Phakopsora pachyrhizi]